MRWSEGSLVPNCPAVARPRRATFLIGVLGSLLWMARLAVWMPSVALVGAEKVIFIDIDDPGAIERGSPPTALAVNMLASAPLMTSPPAGIVSVPVPVFLTATVMLCPTPPRGSLNWRRGAVEILPAGSLGGGAPRPTPPRR